MRPKPLPCRAHRRGAALLVLLAVTASACAGGAGQEPDAAPRAGGAGTESAAPVLAPDTGQNPVAAAGGAPVATGEAAVTAVTGPAARATSSRGTSPAAASVAGAGAPSAGTQPSSNTPSGAAAAGKGPAAPSGAGSSVPDRPAAPLPGGGTTIGVTKDAVTLGLFFSKTGPYAGILRNAQAIAQAAAAEAGLIHGRRLVLKFYDDGTANPSTIQVEEKRAKDEVLSYVSIMSESNVVLGPLADQHKVPAVIGNIDQKVAESLTHVFPVYGYWTRMATILPGFIRSVLGGGGKKIGVVYEGTSTAIDAKNAFKAKAKETGLNVVFEQPIALGQSTCANEVSNLQARGVELVYMMNGPLGAICMLRDAKALGYKPTWTGVGLSWAFNIVAAASGGGADGVRFLSSATTLDTPAGRHFSELAQKAAPNSGADNDDLMLIWYALVRSAIEGLRRAGPDLSRESLLQTWETKMNGYDSGYLPPPTFGPGNRSGPLVFGTIACCTNRQWTTPQAGWRATF